jgi:hypothetical protein
MKPWRPYWKRLDGMIDELLKGAGPAPFRESRNVTKWIRALKFSDLSLCDDDIRVWLMHPAEYAGAAPNPLFEGIQFRWQLILRAECGIAFCRGTILDRRKFNWDQDPTKVYEWLLIEVWRREALYWANRQFSDGNGFAHRNALRSDLLKLAPAQHPSSN